MGFVIRRRPHPRRCPSCPRREVAGEVQEWLDDYGYNPPNVDVRLPGLTAGSGTARLMPWLRKLRGSHPFYWQARRHFQLPARLRPAVNGPHLRSDGHGD